MYLDMSCRTVIITLEPHLLSFSNIPDENMFTCSHSHIAPLLPSSKGHIRDVGFLAANDPKNGAGNIAQVLLGQTHDQQPEVMLNPVSHQSTGEKFTVHTFYGRKTKTQSLIGST